MSPKPWYLNYNEFEFFRNKFNPDWGVEFNTQKFNNVINNTTDGQEKRKYNDIFKEIFRHINNKGVFISYDSSNACNYISYILFKEVEKKNNVEYNEDTFSITKKFVEEFKKEDGYTNDYCESKMFYIDSNIFDKLKNLYYLYDKYYEYTKTPYWKNYADQCNTLGYAIQYHNNIVDNYEEDKDLINKSLVMKGLIEGLKLQPYYECPHRKYLLHKSKIEIEREKEQLEVEARARQQAALLKAQVEESGSKAIAEQGRRTDIQEQQQQVESAHGHEALQEHQIDSVTIDHSKEAETRAASVDYRGPVHNTLSRQYGRYYRERGHSYDSQLENILGSGEERNHISGDPLSSSSEGRGFIHNMKDAFSTISENVDPVPLMGVSGGMGALFLLFRYTPVGTYFRGGRGRARRIPSGFSGPFPGVFPDIQDYEGGHIGYGPMNPLAE
ncbi:hypothetical protein PVX_108255 [Plasmodium vivax]|uniref:VIR protein n=1 Tax=Plasmodium vivax (strain Salvador I) TaxID=126793 RepID=A5KCY7_PLAVS|nr:hypothetical protein PVX_108255 [Plasmodium vivax]EDL42781.1 hypothetical protein PVX_108255 [Plasmodium vivax]|eukprot:XP_001612574.1 hypothetical protein [Plasmodium vivax Sal-1]